MEVIHELYEFYSRTYGRIVGDCLLRAGPSSFIRDAKYYNVNKMLYALKLDESFDNVTSYKKHNSCPHEDCIKVEHFSVHHIKSKEAVLKRIQSRSYEHENCMIYKGKAINKQGYVSIAVDGHMYRLNRVLWWIYNTDIDKVSDIPAQLQIRHLCRNKGCTIADHYASGNAYENAADKVIMGTQTTGEAHHTSKIDLKIAQRIADDWQVLTVLQRAALYKTTTGTIYAIDKRQTWKDVKHPNGLSYVGTLKENRGQRDRARDYVSKNHLDLDYDMVKKGLLERSVISNVINKYVKTHCQEWAQPFNKSYPRVSFFGHTRDAHVWALCAKLGRNVDLERPIVRHLCGNKKCVNLKHLEEGTYQQNMNDLKWHREVDKRT